VTNLPWFWTFRVNALFGVIMKATTGVFSQLAKKFICFKVSTVEGNGVNGNILLEPNL
jgi:hypothetical protein